MEYLARQGLQFSSIFASTRSPSLAADTSLSPEAEHPNEFPINNNNNKWRIGRSKPHNKSKTQQNLEAMGLVFVIYDMINLIWKGNW